MAGLTNSTPHPTEIKLHKQSKLLEVSFDDGQRFSLPFELLRVYSPSAAVRGHQPSMAVLQSGKRNVVITQLEPVGNYAIKPTFSDGHNSGIYSWDILYDLGARQEHHWQDYLARLQAAGASRDVDTTPASKPRSPHSTAPHGNALPPGTAEIKIYRGRGKRPVNGNESS